MPRPSPLQEMLDRFEHEDQPFRRVHRLTDVIEWLVKWSTTLAVADLFRTTGFSDRMRLLAAEGLRRPTLGIWVRFLRTALDELPDTSPWRSWDRVLRAEERHGLVSFRNRYAHGAVPSDAACVADIEQMWPVVQRLLESPVLDVTLLPAEEGRLIGAARSAVVAVPELPVARLDLWPIAVHLPFDDGSDRYSFHFFNALRTPMVETLNYEIPSLQRRRELWDPFHDVLPLDEWRVVIHGLEPFRDELLQLTAPFKGRAEERRVLDDFANQGGMLFLFGPPGIGKSALSALTVLEHRARAARSLMSTGDDGESGDGRPVEVPFHVVEHFIRRKRGSDSPISFLMGVLRRIDHLYGFADERPGATEEELFEALKDRIWRIRTTVELPPLVLVVDGLDESPEIGRFLVRGDARVRVLCTSREIPEVVELFRGWSRDGAGRVDLGPLSESDVRAILYDVVDKYDERLNDRFVRALAKRSDGNPLFLSLYAQELFDDPQRLGDVDRLPRNLSDTLSSAVDRVSDGGRNDDVLEVLWCLAVCAEPLDARSVAHLLGSKTARVRAAIHEASEVLVEVTTRPEERARYQLFHETLREWLVREHDDGLEEISARVAERAASDVGEPEGYLARWGLYHIVDAARHAPATWRDAAVREASDPVRLAARVSAGEAVVVVDHVLDAFDLAAPADRELIARGLASVVLADAASESPTFTPENLHGMLAYRPDCRCYDLMLQHLVDADFVRLLGVDASGDLRAGLLHCAGTRARRRDGVRGDAAELLQRAAAVAAAEGTGVQDSRIHYDLAYLRFLAGEVDDAVAGFGESGAAARRAGDEVAASIATCLQGLVQWHAGRLVGDEFRVVLDDALDVFLRHSERSANAERWVKNARVHLFDLALERGDGGEAARLLDLLRDDPWILRYWTSDDVALLDARLHLCRREFGRAAEIFDRVLEARAPDGVPIGPIEQLSRVFFECEAAWRGLGDAERADRARVAGLRCPADALNWMWQGTSRAWPPQE